MADSSITKKALANSLKELMTEKPFKKINITDICDRCQMNRKSFYYHFMDKYDLVNWIFDTECREIAEKNHMLEKWDFISVMFKYFYDNRTFYRKCFEVEGQNSLSEHFQELIAPAIKARLQEIIGDEHLTDFQVCFLTDAVCSAIKRWLLDKNSMTSDEFLKQMKICVIALATHVTNTSEE